MLMFSMNQAQVTNFQIKDNNNGGAIVSDGQTFYHPTQNLGPTINHEFEIKNISAGTLSLSLRKYEDLMNTVSVTNSDVAQSYFCFGTNCLPATVFSYSIELAPGETTLLEAKFDEASVAGHSVVRFKFNNKINTAEAITVTLKYDSNVGIKTLSAAEAGGFSVGPNPANANVYIKAEDALKPIEQIELIDALGKKVYGNDEMQLTETMIPLQGIAPGIYLLRINGKTQNIQQKILIQ